MPNDIFVFPQDRKDGQPGLSREGGMTKMEYAAIQIFAAMFVGRTVDSRAYHRMKKDAIEAAAVLLG